MQNILKSNSNESFSTSPWVLLLILIGYVIASLFIFSFVGYGLILPFFDFDAAEMMSAMSNPIGNDEAKIPMMILQGVISIGGFVIAPWFFIKKHLKLDHTWFFTLPKPALHPIIMTAVLVFCFMIVNSVLIEWNQHFVFPDWLSSLENIVRDLEDRAEQMTKYLTSFDSFGYFLLALLVIAVVPAVGEELLFRGMIQNLMNHALKNVHAAIWISSLLFSLFHFQFYGLIPRMMLGVLFGYIYYWSGHLSLAMISHFINNAFSLTILYLSQQNILDIDPEELESSPPYYVILLFLTIGILLLLLFRKYFKTKESE